MDPIGEPMNGSHWSTHEWTPLLDLLVDPIGGPIDALLLTPMMDPWMDPIGGPVHGLH